MFENAAGDVAVFFYGRGGTIEGMGINRAGDVMRLSVATPQPQALPKAETAAAEKVARTAPRPWPSFRGEGASGTGDGQGAPLDLERGDGREHPVQDEDSRPRAEQPHRLRQPHLRHHRGRDQGRRRDLPHRPLRRPRLGGRPVRALLPAAGAGHQDRRDRVGPRGPSERVPPSSATSSRARPTPRRSPTASGSSSSSARWACWRPTTSPAASCGGGTWACSRPTTPRPAPRSGATPARPSSTATW